MGCYLANSDRSIRDAGLLYNLVLNEVEKGLIDAVLDFTDGNESYASRILGMSRGT